MSKKRKPDLRVGRTRRWLQRALQELMAEKSYQQIKVSEIVERAEVSRPTFYMHYETKDHLLMSLFDDMLTTTQDEFLHSTSKTEADFRYFATRNFQFWEQNAQAFKLLLDAGVDMMLLQRIQQRTAAYTCQLRAVEGAEDNELVTYMDDAMAGAMFMILKRWIKGDGTVSAKALGNLVADMALSIRATTIDE